MIGTLIAKLKVNPKSRGDLVFTITSRFATLGAAAGSAILVARVMGQEGLGLFALLRTIPSILLICTEMGVSISSPFLINNRKHQPQKVLSNALFAGIVVGVADIVLWLAASPLIGKYLLRGLPPAWVLAACVIPLLAALEADIQNVLRAMRCYRLSNCMRMSLEFGMFLALAGASLASSVGVAVLVPSIIVGHALILVLGVVFLRKIGLRFLPRLDRSLLRESVNYGLRGQAGTAVNILNYRLDHLILAAMTSPAVVGVYVVATKASEFFLFLPGAVGYIMEPKQARRSREEAVRSVQRLWAPVFLVNLAVMVGAFFLGPRLIPFLFDSWSIESVVPFNILLIGLCARGANGVFSSFNSGRGQPEINTYSVVVGLALTISLDLLLIPPWGPTGAAWASSASYVAGAMVLSMFFVRGRHGNAKEEGVLAV